MPPRPASSTGAELRRSCERPPSPFHPEGPRTRRLRLQEASISRVGGRGGRGLMALPTRARGACLGISGG